MLIHFFSNVVHLRICDLGQQHVYTDHSYPVVISVLNNKLKNALRLISQTAARRDLANVAPLHADWSF